MFKKENLNQLQTTPRNISTGVAVKAFLGQPGAMIGWVFLFLGVTASFIFLQYFNFNNFRFLLGSHQQTSG
jgi:hypothetical protein